MPPRAPFAVAGNIRLFSGSAHSDLCGKIAARLGIRVSFRPPACPSSLHKRSRWRRETKPAVLAPTGGVRVSSLPTPCDRGSVCQEARTMRARQGSRAAVHASTPRPRPRTHAQRGRAGKAAQHCQCALLGRAATGSRLAEDAYTGARADAENGRLAHAQAGPLPGLPRAPRQAPQYNAGRWLGCSSLANC